MKEIFAEAVIDLNVRKVDRLFTYRIPEHLQEKISIGSIVSVPFGSRELAGFIVNTRASLTDAEKEFTIKDINAVLHSESLWRKELVELSKWMHEYYGSTFLDALKTCLPPLVKIKSNSIKKTEKSVSIISVNNLKEPESIICSLSKKAPKQAEAISFLISKQGNTTSDEMKNKGFSYKIIKELEQKNLITINREWIHRNPGLNRNPGNTSPLKLNDQQERAFQMISTLMEREKGSVMLLHGTTGSGKTEIYMQALELCLRKGKTGIVLIPEISLSPQALDRFRGRFGNTVALLHSKMTPGERYDEWKRIFMQDARIVLGVRSAVFAPISDIGLVIVDEEHETSYKQESDPRYHARHVAIRRGIYNNALVILGSATPSLESYHLAKEGKYSYCFMPDRVMSRKPPEIKIVDLRKRYNRPGNGLLSPYLLKRLKQTMKNNEQAILFINRRGFFNYLFCRECGTIIKCPVCDISLRLYQDVKNLMKMRCHYCMLEKNVPDICPNCRGSDMSSKGGGTQKIEHELQKLLPDARVIRMDRDTTQKKGMHEKIYDDFLNRKADILLGTQMVTKGFDFPGVTLVGIVLADVALSLPDFRSSERTYQLLLQVAGRSGRGDIPGEVVIQTYNPEHPSIISVANHDLRGFYDWDLINRKELFYPPFLHIIRTVISGPSDEDALNAATDYRKSIENSLVLQSDKECILGPSSCPVTYLNRIYRYQVIIKCSLIRNTMEIMQKARESITDSSINITIDSDSQNFL